MSAGLWSVSVTAAALGSGVVGGVLYGFSAFVMRGLDETRPGSAVAAMQEINRAAPRAPLTVPLLGTALLCVLLAVHAVRDLLRDGDSTPSWWVLAGCALYLVAFVITAAYHVPRNDALMAVDAAGADAAAAWRDYAGPWVRMNHVRAAAAIASSASFMVALLH
ncbi:MAG: anthrone oxygenase family protein [Nocardioides sp.]